MAKVRVYELARELDIESKALLEKLIAGGMDIKSYMSTLDEKESSRAKAILSSSVSEVVEEKRIKPTVIRRRKKVNVEQVIPAVEEAAPAKEEVEAPESELVSEVDKPQEIDVPPVEIKEEDVKGVDETVLKADEAKIKMPEQEVIPQPVVIEPEPPVEKAATPDIQKKDKPKKAKKKKIEQPARIIKLPDVVVSKQKTPDKAKTEIKKPPVRKPIQRKPSEIAKKVAEQYPKKEKKSLRKKDQRKDEEAKRVSKGPTRRRRKEIYEKSDLYGTSTLKRKDRKGGKRSKVDSRRLKRTEITVPKAIKRRIKVQEFVTISDLAKAMGIKAVDLIKKLMALGSQVNINQDIDFETASVVADDFGYELELDVFKEDNFIPDSEDKPEELEARPPVVTIMGHVDHGKTSLLDHIRKSNILSGESGGITQHIGAYYVETDGGDIVFLDTPGHEAFTAMRARGAKVTDLIVLVVAADDGVMPQTKEAVNHARAANIPIVVAVNKIDKPEADPEKVTRELSELGLSPEEWGGSTLFGHISAKTGEGVTELLSLILLQAEMLELKGNPNKAAIGSVIEAKLDKGKGPIATVLIKNGTLKQGDHFICGEKYGRVRAMLNYLGKRMESAGPSVPVEVYGISGVPLAGDEFAAVKDERTAKQIVEHRKFARKKPESGRKNLITLDDFFERMKEDGVKELNIVLKTDVQGSLEALSDALIKQSTDSVKLKVIHSATGVIAESDIMLASASGAIIIGFNMRANPRVAEIAQKEKVDIRYYDVIYDVIKDVRAAMSGLLDPVYKEAIMGHAEVKEIFHVPRVGTVAGCHITDGHVERNAKIRLLRDNVLVFDGKISSLRRFKEDVKEVQTGYECGIGLEKYQDIKPGDVFEAYQMDEFEAEL